MNSNNYIELRNVNKKYIVGDNIIKAISDISFTIKKGEFTVIVGPSGAGKTTLLNLLGGMEDTTEGEIIIDEIAVHKMNDKELTLYRRNDVGFIFQFYNLIPNLTARENIEIALEIVKDPLDIDKMIAAVDLENRSNNFPAQLSGGEQQRVAIARALAKNPKLLLCDEPTGALDYETGKLILQLLHDTSREHNQTVVVVTHNSAIKAMADRVITIKNGQVEKVEINDNPQLIESIEW